MFGYETFWPELAAGSHEVSASAQAFYGSSPTAALDVVEGDFSASFSGDFVRSSATLRVDEADGVLFPVVATDPLAPYGQQVAIRQEVSASGWVQSIPVGRFVIDDPASDGAWTMHHDRAVRMGGTVSIQCPDLLTRAAEAGLSGLVQPRVGATVASEVQRLCSGLLPVDASTIPALTITGAGMVYESDRMAALGSLARLVGRVLRVSRAGVLEMVSPAVSSPVWSVTVPAGTWIDAALTHSRDGLYNAVEATGEDTGGGAAVVRAYVRDTSSSPYAATSPLGERLLRWSSPLMRTQQQVQAAAQSLLASRTAERQVTFDVSCPFNPTVDVLDTHRVTVVPASRTADAVAVTALVTGVKWSLHGGAMEITYSAPRDEVVAWTR